MSDKPPPSASVPRVINFAPNPADRAVLLELSERTGLTNMAAIIRLSIRQQLAVSPPKGS